MFAGSLWPVLNLDGLLRGNGLENSDDSLRINLSDHIIIVCIMVSLFGMPLISLVPRILYILNKCLVN